MNQSQLPLPSPILYCPCLIQTGQERQSVELSNTAYLTDFLHLLGKFSSSRAQVVKIGHRFIVDSISAFFITDNTFRYNRESARSIRIPSLSLLIAKISRRSSSSNIEQLPSIVTRSRLASKHAREYGEQQGLGRKKGKDEKPGQSPLLPMDRSHLLGSAAVLERRLLASLLSVTLQSHLETCLRWIRSNLYRQTSSMKVATSGRLILPLVLGTLLA